MAEPFRCPLCGGRDAEPLLVLRDRFAAGRDLTPPPPLPWGEGEPVADNALPNRQNGLVGRHPLSPRAGYPLGGGTGGEVPPTYPLVRCTRCGLRRLHPQPDVATLAAAYAGNYAPFVRPGLAGRAKGWLERRSVRALWPLFQPPRRVLDVGCASGELLLAIRDAGNPAVSGVEPSADAAARAVTRGLDVRAGMLEDAAFPDGAFDTVVLSHTLEHLPDPLATLRLIQRVLTPGGTLVLWLPNGGSLEAALLRSYWIGYDAPRHLSTFTLPALTRALQMAGFGGVRVTHEALGLEWAWALRLWLRERAPALERALAPLHPLLIVAGTPLALAGALTHRSGRVRVIATRRG